ncbi:hypothetical protein VTG60DRAFT_1216 [Thermothelomyces hinnuleus]
MRPTLRMAIRSNEPYRSNLYREKTVQCLLMGNYTRGGAYTLETLMHYIYIELNLHGDATKDTWSLIALEVNLTIQMGYHRDPSHFPAITPLQGEMRRRLWATVIQGDVLISTQIGTTDQGSTCI